MLVEIYNTNLFLNQISTQAFFFLFLALKTKNTWSNFPLGVFLYSSDINHLFLFQMESAAVSVHNSLNEVSDYQTHLMLREASGRAFAEFLNERVFYWSICETVAVLVIGIGQIIVLRSFFTDKRPTSTIQSWCLL